jgi:hypothetical protein
MNHSIIKICDSTADAGQACSEDFAQLAEELALVSDGLLLLRLRRCSQCRKFYRSSDRGALFDGGELVCRNCIEQWWASRFAELKVPDREAMERRLANWLLGYHGAKVRQWPQGDGELLPAFRLVMNCVRCDGSGVIGATRCGSCQGRGTVRVVVARRSSVGSG